MQTIILQIFQLMGSVCSSGLKQMFVAFFQEVDVYLQTSDNPWDKILVTVLKGILIP